METKTSTRAVIEHHLGALTESIDAVLTDYTEDSVLFTPEGNYEGLARIRGFFTHFLDSLPEGLLEAVKIHKFECSGEVCYLLWEAMPWLPMGTDTFVVREGRIAYQTFASMLTGQ